MPHVHVVVEYNPITSFEDEVTLKILGSFSTIYKLRERKALKELKNFRSSLFLCGNSLIIIKCGDKCSHHSEYEKIIAPVLDGIAYDVEFQENTTMISPSIIVPNPNEALPALEMLPNMNTTPPLRPRTLPPKAISSFTEAQVKEYLADIAANANISINHQYLHLVLHNQSEGSDDAEIRFQNISRYVRHQLRRCNYEFDVTRSTSYDIQRKTFSTKIAISHSGDFNKISEKLPAELATKITFAALKRTKRL